MAKWSDKRPTWDQLEPTERKIVGAVIAFNILVYACVGATLLVIIGAGLRYMGVF